MGRVARPETHGPNHGTCEWPILYIRRTRRDAAGIIELPSRGIIWLFAWEVTALLEDRWKYVPSWWVRNVGPSHVPISKPYVRHRHHNPNRVQIAVSTSPRGRLLRIVPLLSRRGWSRKGAESCRIWVHDLAEPHLADTARWAVTEPYRGLRPKILNYAHWWWRRVERCRLFHAAVSWLIGESCATILCWIADCCRSDLSASREKSSPSGINAAFMRPLCWRYSLATIALRREPKTLSNVCCMPVRI